jgi:hypothetical protein
MNKTRAVFILGAGASVLSGVPTLGPLMDKLDDLRQGWPIGTLPHDYERLQEFLDRAWLAKKAFNNVSYVTPFEKNLEAMLGMLETVCAFDRDSPHFTLEDARSYRDTIVRLIATVVDMSQEPHYTGQTTEQPGFQGTKGYCRLRDTLRKFEDSINGMHRGHVITFNYDVGLEMSLHGGFRYTGIRDTGFETWNPVPISKLHGSLSWSHGEGGITFDRQRFSAWIKGISGPPMYKNEIPQFRRYLPEGREPFIIAPTSDKQGSFGSIRAVHAAAAEALSGANYIAICGYSLSNADQWFREFLRCFMPVKRGLRQICVFDPDKDVLARYRESFKGIFESELVTQAAGLVELCEYVDANWQRTV